VPVLVITGPVGVGKTSTASAASWLLSQQGILHACVDLPQISKAFPERRDDRWNEALAHRNLACMWRNFRAIGAQRLILTRVLETRSLIQRIVNAVPGAQVVVVRLRAPLDVVHERIRARERHHPDWFLAAAEHLVTAMDEQPVEDYLVDNSSLSVDETAREVLSAVGWLTG
jgi:tRNA uridine 5-carbamoylmethylation protein Kti12